MGCSHEEVTDEAPSSAWLQSKALAVLSLVWARRTRLRSALIVRSGNLGHSRREPCVIRSSWYLENPVLVSISVSRKLRTIEGKRSCEFQKLMGCTIIRWVSGSLSLSLQPLVGRRLTYHHYADVASTLRIICHCYEQTCLVKESPNERAAMTGRLYKLYN